MYWWKIDALRAELARGTLSERVRFHYLLVFVVLSVVSPSLVALFAPDEPNLWDRVLTVFEIAVAVIGTAWFYYLNGGSRGHRFLERYLSLGLVYTIRFLVVSLPLVILAYIVGSAAGMVTDETGLFDAVVETVWNVGLLAGLSSQFRRVVADESAAQQVAESRISGN